MWRTRTHECTFYLLCKTMKIVFYSCSWKLKKALYSMNTLQSYLRLHNFPNLIDEMR